MFSISRLVPKLTHLSTAQCCRTLTTTVIRPAADKSDEVSAVTEKKVKTRESFIDIVKSVFGSYQPADPNSPRLPSDDVNFADTTEHATGEEKLFLLAFENGILDPYCNLPTERKGRGTKDNPVKVESFGHERMVACVCEQAQTYVKYSLLYKGEPRRCSCGHWIELVDAPRFWEKIPKEDLIDIPFFRDLEEEGKLDKFLATGELDDGHDHHEQKQLH